MSQVEITLIGHPTTLINLDGQRILTDPWFNDPIHLVCRHKYPLGIPLDKLPPIELLAISHCHQDHFDIRAIKQLDRSAAAVIPIHYHITCFLPFFNTIINPGTPQQFLEQMRTKAPGVRAIVLDTGQTWKADF